MAENIGQVTEDVEALAAEFDLQATALEDLKTAITAKLGGTIWTGPDRDRFESDWEGVMSQNITSVVQSLRGASQQATQNAQEQVDASNA